MVPFLVKIFVNKDRDVTNSLSLVVVFEDKF